MKVLQPILAAGLAIIIAHCNHGCKDGVPLPPGGVELNAEYNAALSACVAKSKTPQESCECRKAVDHDPKFRVCDHPEWPRIGRCDVDCTKTTRVFKETPVEDLLDGGKQ